MGKKLLSLFLLLTMSSLLLGESKKDLDEGNPKMRPLNDWTFFQIGIVPGVPEGMSSSNVYGLKLGIPTTAGYGRVYGIEVSGLYSGTDYINGAQAAWFGPCIAKDLNGAQASWFGLSIARDLNGIQAGSGVSIARDMIGFQAALAVSVARNFCGAQGAIVNVTEDFTGFQAGAVNVVKSLKGVQLGVVNYSASHGCQFGLINIIRDGWLPFSILFNFSY